MRKIKIIARTELGRKAMESHIVESMKQNKKNKTMFKLLGFSQYVTATEPYTIELKIKSNVIGKLLNPVDIISKVKEAITENGALHEIDYDIVKEGEWNQ